MVCSRPLGANTVLYGLLDFPIHSSVIAKGTEGKTKKIRECGEGQLKLYTPPGINLHNYPAKKSYGRERKRSRRPCSFFSVSGEGKEVRTPSSCELSGCSVHSPPQAFLSIHPCSIFFFFFSFFLFLSYFFLLQSYFQMISTEPGDTEQNLQGISV